ncbi:MAG TPA: c-type cytochrome [Noviherbaspirillum sp.]|nr:c-type cytochrome [Noviherbaspirillum sp.]
MFPETPASNVRGKSQLATAALLLASCLAAGTAQAQGKWKSHMSTDEPDKLYRHYCAVCHGENGDGQTMAKYALDPPPADFTSDKARKTLFRAHMIEVLKKGAVTKDGMRTAMISWKDHLNQQQMETLADYIIVKFMDGKAVSGAHPEGHEHHGHDHSHVKQVDYPYGLTPNVARGQSVYAANCQTCHGVKGDGRGSNPRAALIKPRNFQTADFREFANGFTLFSAVSRGRGHMPAWDKNLSNQEIADVSEYVLLTYVKPGQAK